MKTAWLLEAPGPKYVTATDEGYFEWTTDANKAQRYASEKHAREAHSLLSDDDFAPSAGLFAEVGGGKNVLVREHAWP